MSEHPGSPRVLRGAIISLKKTRLVAVVPFQYNPSSISRSLNPSRVAQSGNTWEASRLQGPPSETIDMKISIDATDDLAKAEPIAMDVGISPMLCALETLIAVPVANVIANQLALKAGLIEIAPGSQPFTILMLGPQRLTPVTVETLSIEEQMFDTKLRPIRAEVSLSLKVLTYDDFPPGSRGYAVALLRQGLKESLAPGGEIQAVANLKI